MNFVVYLIIVLLIMAFNASGNAKKAQKRKQAMNQQPAQPVQAKTVPVQQKKAGRQPLGQDEIRKAAEALLKQKAAAPAQPTVHRKPEPASEQGEGFYQGMSFGDEGIDPCHDEMYEERGTAEAAETPAPAPAIQLQFTPNSVLNGVIMSEVLNHHV